MCLLNPYFLDCQVLSSLLKIAECFSVQSSQYLILSEALATEAAILSDRFGRVKIIYVIALQTGYEAVFLMNMLLN
jgi:hypothetical protein